MALPDEDEGILSPQQGLMEELEATSPTLMVEMVSYCLIVDTVG